VISFIALAILVGIMLTLHLPHNHYDMTRAAFEVLPQWQRKKFTGLEERFFGEYSRMSDWYLGNKSGPERKFAEPYQAIVKGQSFHYLLSTDIRENRELVEKGTAILYKNIMRELHRGAFDEAARFMGVLAHGYQDQGTTIHGLEGVEGGSYVSVSNLIAPRPDRPFDSAAVYLCEPQPVNVCIKGYRPQLLGVSVGEAAFRAYERYREQLSFIRGRMIPVIWHKMHGEEAEALRLIAEMTNCNTRAVADVLYTAFCLADRKFAAGQVKRLQKLHLENLHPLEYRPCVSPPYRFSAIIPGYSLTHPDRKAVALKLRVRSGKRVVVKTFKRGMGTGCHWKNRIVYRFPKDVYSKFSVIAGQHATLGVDGAAQLKVRFRGKTVFSSGVISGRDVAGRVTVGNLREGGNLELISADKTGKWSNTANHIVWAEPVVSK